MDSLGSARWEMEIEDYLDLGRNESVTCVRWSMSIEAAKPAGVLVG